ncbi:reverse transcriptase domain-containing protein [Tanacetum coccineum]|uniref:Reverse transcriptase domain-containing protein n=1 Tax=Tanacetum coccineum TaxID=301880 RepID=A0ABQ5IK49_9ASTR
MRTMKPSVQLSRGRAYEATRKDHFPLPFMDQMLERLAGNEYYCFLDGFSGYFQIPIDPKDQEKTTFTCPYGTFAYRRMPFGLCNAPAIFARGAGLGNRKTSHFQLVYHYLSSAMIRGIQNSTIVYTDSLCHHGSLCQEDAKARVSCGGLLLLQEFDIEIRDKKGAENLAADHLFQT